MPKKTPLVDYFIHIFEELRLYDVELDQLVLAWRNSWSGREGISNRLDGFLVA